MGGKAEAPASLFHRDPALALTPMKPPAPVQKKKKMGVKEITDDPISTFVASSVRDASITDKIIDCNTRVSMLVLK